ncbi:DUF4174 domain-containing protein [Marinovum sp.]|uniref:DUF4174 domain-containing protein n=1 Tax=Marinovum sp. TaxID=2024839 RepID=UPI003A5C7826
MILAAAASSVAAQELAVAQTRPLPAEEGPQGPEEAVAPDAEPETQPETLPEGAPEAVQEGVPEGVPVEVPVIQPAGVHELEEYLWLKRPVVVFADSPADPRFNQQMDLLRERLDDLAQRDVVVLTDTDASVLTPLREKLRPRGFMLVLIGKDGSVYLRKPFPWSVREITRSIDKLPLRQQEIRDRRTGG